jgi:S-adenosylmethionine/arginine decarboxylase-like enzyme
MPKYVATIYFECGDDTDPDKALQVATERLEKYESSVKIIDTHVEEDND